MAGIVNINVSVDDLRDLSSIIIATQNHVRQVKESAESSFRHLKNNSELNFMEDVEKEFNSVVSNIDEILDDFNNLATNLISTMEEHLQKISNNA